MSILSSSSMIKNQTELYLSVARSNPALCMAQGSSRFSPFIQSSPSKVIPKFKFKNICQPYSLAWLYISWYNSSLRFLTPLFFSFRKIKFLLVSNLLNHEHSRFSRVPNIFAFQVIFWTLLGSKEMNNGERTLRKTGNSPLVCLIWN